MATVQQKTFRARREQLIEQAVHDSYRLPRKLREPTRCRDCGAVYRDGRWIWAPRGGPAHAARCPACQRVRDKYPAGYVTLSGEFFREHRSEILRRVRSCERDEMGRHPLERIMAFEPVRGGEQVSTTGVHLAQRIGRALERAFKGELAMRYSKADKVLRVRWTR